MLLTLNLYLYLKHFSKRRSRSYNIRQDRVSSPLEWWHGTPCLIPTPLRCTVPLAFRIHIKYYFLGKQPDSRNNPSAGIKVTNDTRMRGLHARLNTCCVRPKFQSENDREFLYIQKSCTNTNNHILESSNNNIHPWWIAPLKTTALTPNQASLKIALVCFSSVCWPISVLDFLL